MNPYGCILKCQKPVSQRLPCHRTCSCNSIKRHTAVLSWRYCCESRNAFDWTGLHVPAPLACNQSLQHHIPWSSCRESGRLGSWQVRLLHTLDMYDLVALLCLSSCLAPQASEMACGIMLESWHSSAVTTTVSSLSPDGMETVRSASGPGSFLSHCVRMQAQTSCMSRPHARRHITPMNSMRPTIYAQAWAPRPICTMTLELRSSGRP